jgi:FKBP-type peptidyl-prolyl cis-trans isomerase (trigger factor)
MPKAKSTKQEETKKAPQTQKQRVTVSHANDNTITISVVVPWLEVEPVRKQVVDRLTASITLPGFRKGKAPKELAASKLSPDTINEEILKVILTQEYTKAIKDNDLKPIINPKIHIEVFTDGTDLEFTATTCEEPKIELKNYKDAVKKLTASSKIVVPGKEEKKITLDQILEVIMKNADAKIPKILAEEEANRLLMQLLDELKRLGVNLDQYLQSRGKTAEEIRAEYEVKAQNDIMLEFILRKVADDEKITVEKEDLEKALAAITDEKERAQIAQNPYVVASIIRQQKTLDFLSKL